MNSSISSPHLNNNGHSPQQENAHSGECTISSFEIDAETIAHRSELYQIWKTLFENDRSAKIIEHPDYLLLELEQYLRKNSSLPPAFVLLYQQEGKPIAAAVLIPKEINTKRAGAFLYTPRLQGYRLAGDRLLGEESVESTQKLFSEIHHILQKQKSHFLLIEDLEKESSLREVAQQLQGCQLFSPTGLQERLRLELPPTLEEYWKTFSSKRRYNLKRERKILEKKGAVTLKRIDSVEQVACFLEDAHQVSLKSWQTRQLGLRVGTSDADLQTYTFLASAGALRSYLLYLDNEPIAFMIGHQYNGVFHYEEVGFDSDYAKFSPGKALLVAGLEDIYSENKPTWFDFGLGDADYKRQMSNHHSQSGMLWIVPAGFKNRIVMRWLKTCRAMKCIARNLLQSTGLFRRLRQIIRRSKGGK
ncbi:hypothetical protein MNBD_PLANCTO02-2928 [hydrothermal vent metagenome]|uniref:BioF2-like acetyltransferase domain-containing protein n=1 Tax=hydrothermal vent metagenome TaxID=652676 RepID=A0A3B1D617_9ZZZZ